MDNGKKITTQCEILSSFKYVLKIHKQILQRKTIYNNIHTLVNCMLIYKYKINYKTIIYIKPNKYSTILNSY